MKEVLAKANLSITHYQNTWFLTAGTFLIKETIANSFDEYFIIVRPKLAGEIPLSQRPFEKYLKESDSSFE